MSDAKTGNEKTRTQPRLGNIAASEKFKELFQDEKARKGLDMLNQAEIAYFEQAVAFLNDPTNAAYLENKGGWSWELVESVADDLKDLAKEMAQKDKLRNYASNAFLASTGKALSGSSTLKASGGRGTSDSAVLIS